MGLAIHGCTPPFDGHSLQTGPSPSALHRGGRRRKRGYQRWLDRIRALAGLSTRTRLSHEPSASSRFSGFSAPAVSLPAVWIAGAVFAMAGVACEKQPASIRVKGPRDAVESTSMNPVFPAFEKKSDTIKLRASAFDKDGVFMGPARVKWESTDRTVATVSADGLVTILSSGEAAIKATTEGYDRALESTLPVKAIIVDAVKIVPTGREAFTLHLGETKQFQAEVLDDRGNIVREARIRWRTSDYAATVTETGEVEGRAIGDTQLIAEVSGKTARADLKVADWDRAQGPSRNK